MASAEAQPEAAIIIITTTTTKATSPSNNPQNPKEREMQSQDIISISSSMIQVICRQSVGLATEQLVELITREELRLGVRHQMRRESKRCSSRRGREGETDNRISSTLMSLVAPLEVVEAQTCKVIFRVDNAILVVANKGAINSMFSSSKLNKL